MTSKTGPNWFAQDSKNVSVYMYVSASVYAVSAEFNHYTKFF